MTETEGMKTNESEQIKSKKKISFLSSVMCAFLQGKLAVARYTFQIKKTL